MEKKIHLFMCSRCAMPDDLEVGTVQNCSDCGGKVIDTGKSYEEWESVLEQMPDAPPKLPDSEYFDFCDVFEFVRKQVIDPLGTYNPEEEKAVHRRYAVPTGLHCPRCSSTNIQGNQGGFEYAFGNGVGSSGYGWNSATSDNLVITGRNRCKCNTCGYTWRP